MRLSRARRCTTPPGRARLALRVVLVATVGSAESGTYVATYVPALAGTSACSMPLTTSEVKLSGMLARAPTCSASPTSDTRPRSPRRRAAPDRPRRRPRAGPSSTQVPHGGSHMCSTEPHTVGLGPLGLVSPMRTHRRPPRLVESPWMRHLVRCRATLWMTTWRPVGVTFGDDGRWALSGGGVALVPSTA